MAYHPFRNPWLKLLSIVVAVLLWLTVTRDQSVERSIRVPLEYQNMPEALEIIGDPPGTVDVRVRGPSSALGRLDAGDVVAVLDLRLAKPGSRLFHLLTDQVRAPWGVEVAQVSPPTVSLEFERSSRKVVPIVPSVEGEPAPGFVAGRVTAFPATVEVIGPETRLNRLTAATTEPVSIQGAAQPVTDIVTVGVIDSALRLRAARTATVTVQINPAPIERTLLNVPVGVRNLSPGMTARLTPSRVTVVVRGTREAVLPLEGPDLGAFVDVSNLARGRYVLPVKGDPGKSPGIVRAEPASVEVRIR
jgi:YbbR domain-containing protein